MNAERIAGAPADPSCHPSSPPGNPFIKRTLIADLVTRFGLQRQSMIGSG
jgi:hypothetical protein